MLQEQSPGVENGGVGFQTPQGRSILIIFDRETNLDDVLQINNVFVNVSKGEVAKSGDLQKAFGKINISDIVKEVRRLLSFVVCLLIYLPLDPQERGSSSGRERKRPRPCFPTEGNCHSSSREMCRSSNAAPIPCRHDREGDGRGGLQC